MDSRIIQLTEVATGEPIWVSTAHIVHFRREKPGETVVGVDTAMIFLKVKETPEQVLNLMNGLGLPKPPPAEPKVELRG